jgi:hypothetical protein
VQRRPTPPAPGVPPGESAADRERALRERVLDKYRRGLR